MIAVSDLRRNADRGAPASRQSALLAALLAIVWLACSSIPAMAQGGGGGGPPPLSAITGNIHLSSSSTLFDLSSRFLRVLGNEAAWHSTGAPRANNPGGGGADMPAAAVPGTPAPVGERYRTWFEGYGLQSRMDPQGDFRGDRRETWGGIAGFGWTAAPGLSFGLSVDQGHTRIEIAPLAQSAKLDLTQIGGNAAFESGPWTFGVAVIHGFGEIDASRGVGNPSIASYDANLWGVLTELSYLWSSGNWRLVPKLGFDWTRTETSSFTETGGPTPVRGSEQVNRRARILAGAEIGHTWFAKDIMLDLAAYGRFVDIVSLDIDPLLVTSPTGALTPRLIAGVSESRTGFDAGASASLRLSKNARLYAIYDGRFRSNFESHGGTLGLELRW